MIRWLLIHRWKASVRSILRAQNLAANIIFGIVVGILGMNLLGIGLFLDRILARLGPEIDPVAIVNRSLVYYLAIDLFLRFFLQRIPSQAIEPYRHLPVKRSTVLHYLLLISTLSLFNILPLFVIVPFALRVIVVQQSPIAAVVWLFTVLLLILCNSYLNFLFKKQIIASPKVLLPFALAVIVLGLLDHYTIVALSHMSTLFLGSLVHYPVLAAVPAAALTLLYAADYRFLQRHSYADELQLVKQRSTTQRAQFRYFDRLSQTGTFIALELKLLQRNRRSRASVYLALAILPIGLLFYSTIPFDEQFYHTPDRSEIGRPLQGIDSDGTDSTMAHVTFRIIPDRLPEQAHIYVAGNHPLLGNWDPSIAYCERQPDGSWVRTFVFPHNTELEYKFTLGSWQTQAVQEDGSRPPNSTLSVNKDTTVTTLVTGWRVPQRSAIAGINLIYIGLLLTGMLMLVYGQFILSWESNYFDALLSQEIDYQKYFKAKLLLLIAASTVFFLLTIPYAFYSLEILKINAALSLYNAGINTFVLLFMSTFSRKRLDLNASLLSTQGKGASQYLTIFPTLILPVMIYGLLRLSGFAESEYLVFGLLGLIGLIVHRQLMHLFLRRFHRQKHAIAAGFRQG